MLHNFYVFLTFHSHLEEEEVDTKDLGKDTLLVTVTMVVVRERNLRSMYLISTLTLMQAEIVWLVMVGDGSLGLEQIYLRGVTGSDTLMGSNWIPMSPQISTQAHMNTPRNVGATRKNTKDKDFQLFPPTI